MVEVILITKEQQKSAKNYDNVIKFLDILRNKQPQLYKENFEFFDDTLIDYYCFNHDIENIRKAFTLFMENPMHDYNKYLQNFTKLLYYQHTELINLIISENCQGIVNSEDLVVNSGYELAVCKFYILLQECYEKNTDNLDNPEILSLMEEYNLEFSGDILSDFELGLFKPILDSAKLKAKFKSNKHTALVIFQAYFLRYMHKKGFEFYLSGTIWEKMMGFWQENNSSKNSTENYFEVKIKIFEKYLSEFMSDIFLNNRTDTISFIWASVYIYEFLYDTNLISEKVFRNFIELTKVLKAKTIVHFTPELCYSNYVHYWEKPDCISEIEFIEEKKIFEKSLSFNQMHFSELQENLTEELSKIGELSDYIIKEAENEKKKKKIHLLDTLLNKNANYGEHYTPNEPFRVEKKIGRNEPCICGSGKKYKKCCG